MEQLLPTAVPITEASRILRRLAERIAAAYITATAPQAILLTGSTADGDADYYSDLDIITYYEQIPSEDAMCAARTALGAGEMRWLGDRAGGAGIEIYRLEGVECQIAHLTVAHWEHDMSSILEGLDVTSPVQKAFNGVLHGIPLLGAETISRWQERLAVYPEALATAMVTEHLQFFPLWNHSSRLALRDAQLWCQETLAESERHLLGILAGLNRLYYSPFQFKRLHRFVDAMTIVPEALAERLDALLRGDTIVAANALKQLVQETVLLVEEHMPQIDTTAVRRSLNAPAAAPWGNPE